MAQFQREGERGAQTWAGEQRLGDPAFAVTVGDVYDQLRSIADERDAALLVCGSRRLSAVTRVFTASVGTTLASWSSRPVAVVPPDWRPHAAPRGRGTDSRSANNDSPRSK